VQTRRFEWVFYALPMAIIWGFYLLAFFPGFLSGDSISQWRQMQTGAYVNWQPPFHTMTNWLITRIWYSPAAVCILQIVIMSSVLGWGLSVLRRLGSPAWLTWVTTIFLAISPANGIYAITLWKDILFSAFVVALTLLILHIVNSKGKWLEKRINAVVLGVILTLVALFRQNGDFVSAGVIITLMLVFRYYWKKLLLSMTIFLALLGLVKTGLYQLANVMSIDMARYQIVLFNVVAAHQEHGTYFTPEENALVKGGFPEERLPYVCSRNTGLTSLLEHNDYYRNYLIDHTGQIIDLVKNLTLRSPEVTINHFICNGAFVYRMFQYLPYYETGYLSIVPNNFGIKSISLLPGIHQFLTKQVKKTMDQNGMNWLVWRIPFWMFLLLSGIICLCFRRRNWNYLLVLLPGLLAILPLIFLSFGQIFRYVYSMYLCGILLSGYFWVNATYKYSDQLEI
jgi:hypothetical protein